MASYLITGTAQGIGLELTKQLLDLPASQVSHVFALTRSKPSPELQTLLDNHLDRATSVIASVTDETAVKAAAEQVEKKVGEKGLDVLVNNAGSATVSPDGLRTVPAEDLKRMFDLNVVGVQHVTVAFLPLLEKGEGKKIVNISSAVGSITLAPALSATPTHAYKISKAALNMLTVQYATDLKAAGFTVIAITPGWLKTKLGGENVAHMSVEQGVTEVKRIILETTSEDSGKFLNIKVPGFEFNGIDAYPGGEVPW